MKRLFVTGLLFMFMVVAPVVSSFAAGPEVVTNSGPISSVTVAGLVAQNGTPTPTTPIDIVSNNGVLKVRHQSDLPLGYTLLDSVVFNSTQVINTGFTPNNNSRIESKWYRTGADCWFYGASPSNPRITLYHSNTGTSRWGNQSRNNFGFSANTEYTLIQDKNGLTINGTLYPWNSGTAGDFTCDRSLTIGNSNGSTSVRYFAGNFYYMKIWDNGVLVRDFVPCKNASNVVGLYDRVNGVFYTDTGLVAGNPVNDLEIYTDGTVETIGDSANHTATVATLLGVGDYRDTQNINTGAITRNVGVKVLDGTEGWVASGASSNLFYSSAAITNADTSNNYKPISTHFNGVLGNTGYAAMQAGDFKHGSGNSIFYFKMPDITTAAEFKQWLAEQYAAGTPVIIIYPLATPTTESVAGQTMTTAPVNNRTGGVTGMTITTMLSSGASVVTTIATNAIKIATTAYNSARFNPVKTDLNNAVATIREIVTKTINQTAAIASLQADKQTRPEDACPAGKKCLLVETEENGVIVPHWFPIIEAPENTE